ncbi:DNA ligase D [Dyella sp. ASV21]|uniref:DNA ligase D n=1 Tax=Dyella sp. ASV21 TaxID=2795114 RepID=UPI0018EA472D|nr:DNA ligase D [Dyella sp. ASV21]
MARPIWSGTLSFGLLNAPVSLMSAERSVDLHFRMLDSRSKMPIRYERVNADWPGRTGEWLKFKRLESDEFAVVGYTRAKGQRQGSGSLLLGRPSPRGGWNYAARVGARFSAAQLSDIASRLAVCARRKPTVHVDTIDPLLRDAQWVAPRDVIEVYYRGLGGHGLLRQPSLKTLRPDKSPGDLRDLDRRELPPSATTTTMKKIKGKKQGAVAITHPERIVFPDMGITKHDVAEYYAFVMDWFLPGVVDRPVSVLRCPEGLKADCFFQKHMIEGLKHVGSAFLQEESGAKRVYLYPTGPESIIELVQFGAMEFHCWGATIEAPECATQIVLDLDPAEDVAWSRVIAAARLTRRLLQRLSLQSFVRTTGGKGLHVVLPLRPAVPWETAKAFARSFATAMAEAHPDEFVAVASKAKRMGRIYIDYLRNSRGATSIASYSLRARPGAPVSVPLRWEELGRLTSASAFNIRTLRKRLGRLRGDPWEGFDAVVQGLTHITSPLAR